MLCHFTLITCQIFIQSVFMLYTLLYKCRILVSAHSKILLSLQALIDSRVIRSYKKIVPQELFTVTQFNYVRSCFICYFYYTYVRKLFIYPCKVILLLSWIINIKIYKAINCIPTQDLAAHLISQLYMEAFLLAVTFYILRLWDTLKIIFLTLKQPSCVLYQMVSSLPLK